MFVPLLMFLFAAAPACAGRSTLEMARAQDPRDVPSLRETLGGERASDRAAAAFALGQYGLFEVPEASTEPVAIATARAAAAAALVPASSDPEAGVRRAVVQALGKVGSADDETALLAAATDADAGVRGEAALALFRMRFLKRVPEYSTAAATKLSQLSADPEAEVRWRAAYAASRWPEPRLAQALAVSARDADARVRLFSVRALGKLAVAPEAVLFADPDAYVRAEAVAALASAKAWGRLPDSVFADPSAHVRAAAADAAGASGDAARFSSALERMAAEPGTLAAGRALLALAQLRRDAAAALLARARQDPRWWIRARAFEASASLADGGVILRDGVADPDPRVSSQALESLAASTSPYVVSSLDRVLRDPKAPLELRGTAVDAAGALKDPELLGGLFESMKAAAGPGSAELRESIRKALLSIAEKHPDRAGAIRAALKGFAPFTDKTRRLRASKTPLQVEMATERGTFVIALSPPDVAGTHVAAFAESVKKGFYDGLTWHRVVTAFVVQGGDPRGSGWGDAGWRLADEISPLPFLRGTVGMPKAGKDTGGCQLFVSLVPTPHLDGRYTVFGSVVSGLEVLDLLQPGDKILSARIRSHP